MYINRKGFFFYVLIVLKVSQIDPFLGGTFSNLVKAHTARLDLDGVKKELVDHSMAAGSRESLSKQVSVVVSVFGLRSKTFWTVVDGVEGGHVREQSLYGLLVCFVNRLNSVDTQLDTHLSRANVTRRLVLSDVLLAGL